MENNEFIVNRNIEFFMLDFENEVIHQLRALKKLPPEQNFAKKSFFHEGASDAMGQLELSNTERIGYFYNKDENSLSLHYIRPLAGLAGDSYDNVVRREMIKMLKPYFGFPAFTCDAVNGTVNQTVCTFIEYPLSGHEKERFETIKKQNKQIYNCLNYQYIAREYKRYLEAIENSEKI